MLSTIYNTLQNQGYTSDKGTAHSYIDFYEGLFYPYKHKSINVLEIGIQYGFSCALWVNYFTNATIYGMDIEEIQSYKFGYNFIKGDSTSWSVQNEKFKGLEFDIIIDDGSHETIDQCNTFALYWQLMKKGGIYIIEDMYEIEKHLPEFEETFKKFGATYELFDFRNRKGRVDDTLIVLTKEV